MCKTNETPAVADKVETSVCGRCGGTGQYSYCQTYGTTCFQCRGRGHVMTKRGFQANQFIVDARTIPARAIRVGDVLRLDGVTMGGKLFRQNVRVCAINGLRCGCAHRDESGKMVPVWFIAFTDGKGNAHSVGLNDRVLRIGTPEESHATFAAGMLYQSRLTKSGKLAKRWESEYTVARADLWALFMAEPRALTEYQIPETPDWIKEHN